MSILSDLNAAIERDPAATCKLEVLLLYPGFHAVLAYRIAHGLRRIRIPFLPKLISMLARALTGIEIHPGAVIGRGLFIDHGMGTVIGETAVIGDNVTVFQGVTLGGTGKEKGKRHPTLGNNVVVGAGAKILGNIAIGDNVMIGANAVVLKPIPPDSTVVGVPGRVAKIAGEKFPQSRLDHTGLPDPLAECLEHLQEEISEIEKAIEKWKKGNQRG